MIFKGFKDNNHPHLGCVTVEGGPCYLKMVYFGLPLGLHPRLGCFSECDEVQLPTDVTPPPPPPLIQINKQSENDFLWGKLC